MSQYSLDSSSGPYRITVRHRKLSSTTARVQDPTRPYFGFAFAVFDGDASVILYEAQIDEAMSCGGIILPLMVPPPLWVLAVRVKPSGAVRKPLSTPTCEGPCRFRDCWI